MPDVHDQLRGFWDRDAETYDRSASHAASDPVEAAAWRAALLRHLPSAPASVLDAGAGTGAMSLLAAELGYRVTAFDLSPGMLAHARRKAGERGLALDTFEGPAESPPPGPFDAVIERHLLWTTPDPVAALSAWRRSAPGGRLVLFEVVFDRLGSMAKARGRAAGAVRKALRTTADHHGGYDSELLASLPLARSSSPAPVVAAAESAGWRRVRIERLHDVEWARRLAAHPMLGRLEGVPQYALVADDTGR
jgi:SAM-dependent methyltransferase